METPGVFDIVGPIMVGPSSSHTAGAVRLGQAARLILGARPGRAELTLHGSFAATGVGHGTKLALTAGLLGMSMDDERIKRADRLAQEAGLQVTFAVADLGDVHPNTVAMKLANSDRQVEVVGSSVGGGRIVISRIDDFTVSLSGRYFTLLTKHRDEPGMVARITSVLADFGINIAFLEVARRGRGDQAMLTAQTDQEIPPAAGNRLTEVPGIAEVRLLKPF